MSGPVDLPHGERARRRHRDGQRGGVVASAALCLERAKLVVEPGGAASVAALMETPQSFEPPVLAVLSGGNIDPVLLLRVLRHGMAAAGRYLSFRLGIPDRPGEFAQLLGALAESGANVPDVEHMRPGPNLHLDE